MFQIAHYYGQEIVEIMSDTAGQLSDCLHLLRLTKLVFSHFLFRDVPRDLGEPQQAARCITAGVNDDARHEGGSVLTTAPTLRLIFSGPLCCREGGPGQSLLAVVFGIEAQEVLAENFGR